MRKVICLRLGKGSLETGFSEVVASLYEIENEREELLEENVRGSLPANPEIAIAYQKWQLLYDGFVNGGKKSINSKTRAITFAENSIDRGNQENAVELPAYLLDKINKWLDSPEFQLIDRVSRERINLEDEVLLVIQTDGETIRKLPWEKWNLIEKYTKAEVALSAPQFSSKQKSVSTGGKVRILAIVGDCTGIDPEADLKSLRSNRDVKLEILSQPSRQQIRDRLRDESGWDILFYTGHSNSSAKQGWIKLDENTKLEISELNLALQAAVEKGLQLAIFNSCQGLGLVPQLEELGIPQIIVMRESVQNQVAQKFLTEFIKDFSKGRSFYVAIREARNKLKEIEDEYYCASWLPVVCQHWSAKPPTWEELRGNIPKPSVKTLLLQSGLLGLFVAFSIVLLRSLGLLQALELKAFDLLMRIRPHEGIDSRLLIVEATEEDINRLGYPLPDGILARTIEQIEEYQPRVIGLQIFRDRPVEPGHQQLLNLLQNNNRIVPLCSVKLTDDDPNQPGISSLPEVPPQRLGFSNIKLDESDGILRRQLLFMSPDVDDPCPTEFSFSSQLALRYLSGKGIQPKILDRDRLKIGETIFKRLQSNSGGYYQLDNRGFQILLNYRNLEKVAQAVSITDVLANKFDPELIKDRIVIVGVVAPISNPTDYFSTPYSKGVLPQMSGVTIQAQMTSQILSAVLDERPLLKTWSETQEIILILICSLAGSFIAVVCVQNRIYYWLVLGSGIALLVICYFCLFSQGLWLPLIPSTAGLIISSISGSALLKNWQKITNLNLFIEK